MEKYLNKEFILQHKKKIMQIGAIVLILIVAIAIYSVKDDSFVIETSGDRVRVEFAKFALSTNNTAEKEAAKKKAAALAARKEAKEAKKKK